MKKTDLTDKTRRSLFHDLKEYLGITTWEHRIRFAREQGLKIHSFTELDEAKAQRLIEAVMNAVLGQFEKRRGGNAR
jgi:hypothetical protein